MITHEEILIMGDFFERGDWDKDVSMCAMVLSSSSRVEKKFGLDIVAQMSTAIGSGTKICVLQKFSLWDFCCL
jgi:predicted regulator of Ras-like GTPase activity (Roadblock/LC7/MglB family)